MGRGGNKRESSHPKGPGGGNKRESSCPKGPGSAWVHSFLLSWESCVLLFVFRLWEKRNESFQGREASGDSHRVGCELLRMPDL